MTNKKLNIWFSIILMSMSMIMLMSSISMIVYSFSIMLEWLIISVNLCNIYMKIIFDLNQLYFYQLLYLFHQL